MDEALVHRQRADDVACLVIDHPPVNAFNVAVRAALERALNEAAADPDIVGVVIGAAGKLFSGGGDMREIGKPPLPGGPTMTELVARIEAFPKPVAVAIQGRAIGGGILLALGCHARLATPAASVALPEVRLGFVPGVGGTQRLPRLVGLEKALEVIALAEPLDADSAHAAGFFDAVVAPADLLEAAAQHVRAVASGEKPWRRTALLDVPRAGTSAERAALRSRFRTRVGEKMPGHQAPVEAIDIVLHAAETTFVEGARREKDTLDRLVSRFESRALLHLFFAGRTATTIDKSVAIRPGDGGTIHPVRPLDRPQSRLVELVAGDEIGEEALQTALADARQQRLTPVLVRKASVIRRLEAAYASAVRTLQAQGRSAEEIAAAARAEGFRLPFPETTPKADAGIARTLVDAMVAEAHRCLSDGLVERPGDVDFIAVEACGFPERYGGPLFYAAEIGKRS